MLAKKEHQTNQLATAINKEHVGATQHMQMEI